MGKPVILLGPSFYDQLDVAYTPEHLAEAHRLLRSDLPPKGAGNAARAANYFLKGYDQVAFLGHNGRTVFPIDGFFDLLE